MSTSLTPAQLEIYRQAARQREAEQKKLLEERRQHAWDVARKASAQLKAEFGASRVVVIGSLLHPSLFHMRSDIDLVVWDVQRYFRAVAFLMDLDTSLHFDLIPAEDATPAILSLVEQEGVEL